MADRVISVERDVEAPPSVVFDILTDPRMHPAIDGSGSLRATVRGPERLSKGSRFGMRMRLFGLPYAVPNTVVEFEPDRLIAWHHPARHRWRYELEPLGGERTLVRESFDWSTSVFRPGLEWLDVPSGHVPNMLASLDNLARIAAERHSSQEG